MPSGPVACAEPARTRPHVLSWVGRRPVLPARVVVGVLLLFLALSVLVMLLLDVAGYV
ncbi:hypothetical protein ABZ234_15415 [Nocardiopsis sp. NPDC006198]|uniref:hypothetical protein n=1 Tax=Nocardiopsis sp. NPDC006198 TaxID=3154472 RepID=UPI0033BA60F5